MASFSLQNLKKMGKLAVEIILKIWTLKLVCLLRFDEWTASLKKMIYKSLLDNIFNTMLATKKNRLDEIGAEDNNYNEVSKTQEHWNNILFRKILYFRVK